MKKPICKCGQNEEVCIGCILDWVERAVEILKDIETALYVDLPATRIYVQDLIDEVEE